MSEHFITLTITISDRPGGTTSGGTMGVKKKPATVLTDDLKAISELCELVNGCWVPTVSGRVPCRVHGDDRPVGDLPTVAPHRWVWTVAQGFTRDPGPLVHVRRECSTARCCNPKHLFATTSDGVRLSKAEFKDHMKELGTIPTPSERLNSGVAVAEKTGQGVAVVRQSLDDVMAHCRVSKSGCWIPNAASQYACRMDDDTSTPDELPRMGLHRWSWLVANAHSPTELPSTHVHVRRTCSTRKCCNPQHLYAASPDGHALTVNEIRQVKDCASTSLRKSPSKLGGHPSASIQSDNDAYLRSVLMF
ncbi:hypothetical protein hbim_03722 [Mycolicibacterium mageritense]|uniref:HNH nuclease domain-containing protein n=1 Tax=Mycolicibacterium mageritense TaxID=53462 RepID=A0AAI8TWG0_MYCME|nr:hypothetical protein hbim_03722 [Mycolicibacterium mageritense]